MLLSPSASPDEAAAIAAAIARLEADAAPAGAPPTETIGAWQRAALAEGVGAKRSVLDDPGGGLKWLS